MTELEKYQLAASLTLILKDDHLVNLCVDTFERFNDYKYKALQAEVADLENQNEQLKQDVSFWKSEYAIQHDEFANEITEKVKQNKALQAEVEQLKQTIEYLYDCYKSGSGLIDHVEDEVRELITDKKQ